MTATGKSAPSWADVQREVREQLALVENVSPALPQVEQLEDNLNVAPKKKTHPFPGNVLMHIDAFHGGDSHSPDRPEEKRTPVTDLESAALVTSLYDAGPFELDSAHHHRPVIDIDLPVTVLPSSTPGHHHLFIDKPMTWEQYQELLHALVRAGIVEDGYVEAARRRGWTAVRVPWLRKGDPPPLLPEQRAAERAAAIEQATRIMLREGKGLAHDDAKRRLRVLLDVPAVDPGGW